MLFINSSKAIWFSLKELVFNLKVIEFYGVVTQRYMMAVTSEALCMVVGLMLEIMSNLAFQWRGHLLYSDGEWLIMKRSIEESYFYTDNWSLKFARVSRVLKNSQQLIFETLGYKPPFKKSQNSVIFNLNEIKIIQFEKKLCNKVHVE